MEGISTTYRDGNGWFCIIATLGQWEVSDDIKVENMQKVTAYKKKGGNTLQYVSS